MPKENSWSELNEPTGPAKALTRITQIQSALRRQRFRCATAGEKKSRGFGCGGCGFEIEVTSLRSGRRDCWKSLVFVRNLGLAFLFPPGRCRRERPDWGLEAFPELHRFHPGADFWRVCFAAM